MPAIFIGHGNPLNAVSENEYTKGWSAIGQSIPRPAAIISVSAHYYVPFCMVTSTAFPPTIHDFSGFPKALYQISYPAPGDPDLARRIKSLLSPHPVISDDHWGFDHGTWSVLRHMFPDADIPVVQLSIHEKKPAQFHYDVGRLLAPLRKENILIFASGNIVHNLKTYQWKNPDAEPFDWAVRFEKTARQMMINGNHSDLINYPELDPGSDLAVPTPDHYLPLLYILGASRRDELVRFPIKGVDGGSVSMLAVQIG